MQWPPTKPGLNGKKFHLLPAASKTAWVSIFNFLNSIANSFISAIFRSLCVFSITFAASATWMLSAINVPAGIIDLYNKLIILVECLFDPETTFLIVFNVCFLSPGLILSGL